VSRHEASDVALLHLPASGEELSTQVYRPLSPDFTLIDGGDFLGHGYPVEGSANALPVGRLFKGHFQRYFGYEPPSGGSGYFAAEMSTPAPAGLSGGVLAYANEPDVAVAVVTTNVDSWVTIDRFESVEREGQVYREEIRRVVSYGIAAMLTGLGPWLEAELSGT
jgi:hypothetical protein